MPIQSRFIDSGGQLSSPALRISFENRAFRYGDGVFETILVRGGQAVALPLHLARMQSGANCLGIESQGHSVVDRAAELVDKLLKGQATDGFGRMRISLFRADGGHYLPASDDAILVGEVHPLPHDPWTVGAPLRLSVAWDYPLLHTPLSAAKSMNALPYIMAARQAHAQGLDDALLLHANGELAELTASNLFVVRNGSLLTPHLASACLPGTMRARVLAAARSLGLSVTETRLVPEVFGEISEAFATNGIRGLQPIGAVAELGFSCDQFPVMEAIRALMKGKM